MYPHKVRKFIANLAKNWYEMKVERDSAGFVLPFAASVTAAVYAGASFCGYISVSAATAMTFTAAALVILLHPVHRTWSRRFQWVLIITASVSAGWLCGMTSHMMEISMPDVHGRIGRIALKAGTSMQAAIDGIPFRSPDTNAILKALLTGERSDIPVHITAAFRESGASHILALSGLHLGILYGIISKALAIIGNTPSAIRIRSAATVLACGFYTIATGAGASIVRAFLFILLGETARLTGRYRSTGSVLSAALIIQLVLDPQSARSVSFQLSYAAMAGIAFIFPRLRRLWPTHDDRRADPIRWIWNSAAMSISCQITTGPLAYAYFGTFPKHFLLTNLIAIPITGIIIPMAVATLLLSSMGTCPGIMLKATELLVQALSAALAIIASM